MALKMSMRFNSSIGNSFKILRPKRTNFRNVFKELTHIYLSITLFSHFDFSVHYGPLKPFYILSI